MYYLRFFIRLKVRYMEGKLQKKPAAPLTLNVEATVGWQTWQIYIYIYIRLVQGKSADFEI